MTESLMARPGPGMPALGSALRDVDAILGELVSVVSEQTAAIAAHRVDQLEQLAKRHQALNDRLLSAERRRIDALAGQSLRDAAREGGPEISRLTIAIARKVVTLREDGERNASLFRRGSALAQQAVQFLQRMIAEHSQGYGAPTLVDRSRSVLVDGRA